MTDLSSRSPAVKTGDFIDERYRIIKTLGVGSMGAVFLAEHIVLKGRVAIRILRPEIAQDPEALDPYLTEARAAGTLGHPGIAACIDAGFVRAGVPYVVHEYLDGALLTDEVYRVGGLPIRRALEIADQIASALLAAHRAGIVHRELKSDHVFLIDQGDAVDVVKVFDFGTSRLYGSALHHTLRGIVPGSPEFMAPEQVISPATVDHRADIYALGVILYEMLTARRPFSDDDKRALLHRVVNEPPPPLLRRDAPPGLEEMIASRLLAKDPAQRFASMQDVRGALEAFAAVIRPNGPVSEPLPVAEPPPAEPPPAEPPPPRLSEAVALPALPRPRSARLGWLLAALGVGGFGAAVMYVEGQTTAAGDQTTTAALDNDAEKIASILDSEVRAAHLRADGIATMPMLRAAVETDAATLKDMVGSDFIFTPKPGEVLELFQLRDGAATSLLRIPESAAPIAPIAASQTRIASDGNGITITVGAPVAKQQAGVGGSVALSVPLDLTLIKKRVAEHARSAAIVGFGAPVRLVGAGTGDAPVSVEIPLSSDLRGGEVSLVAAVAAPPYAVGGKLRVARITCWGVAGALVVLYLASLLRGRKRS